MALLIDGYNLLNATGIVGPRSQPATFAQARTALINFVTEAVAPAERPATTIVFDAGNAPPGLPSRFEHRGVTVLFSRGYEDADAMIEALIRADSAPRRLTVVSSDHRIQRAARRRKARDVDSDVWYAERWRAMRTEPEAAPADPRPPAPLSPEEVAAWLRTFGDIDVERLQAELATDENGSVKAARARKKPNGESLASDSLYNPFPPGYAEELLKESEGKDPSS